MRRLFVVVVIGLSGCMMRAFLVDDGASAGKRDFGRSCAVCHGVGGRGDGPMAKSLRKSPSDLTGLTERHQGVFPEQYVIDVVTGRIEIDSHGSREMPIWSDRFSPSDTGAAAAASIFSRRSVNSLAEYLRSIQRSSRR